MTALFLSGCDNGSQTSGAITFSASRLDVTAVLGRAGQQHFAVVNILAAGKRWNVSADAPWVSVLPGTQQGDATLTVGVNSSGMGVGAREARLTLVNADDPADTDSLIVTLIVQLPAITAPSTLTLGGPDGLDTLPQNLEFWIDTGFNSYGWTLADVSLVPNDVNWLELSKTSGTAADLGNGGSDVIVIDANRDGLVPGIYEAHLTLRFDVLGETVTHDVLVTLNHEENRIYAVKNGVAFYQMPARNRLSASVQVLSSRDLMTIPWSAVSSQPWLTVTPSGLTGGTLNLQADTSTLAADAVHAATVTITSSNAEVQNQETIAVVLWKGSNNPGDIIINTSFDEVVTNPVFPYVHTESNGTLRTYNIYTGAQVSSGASPYANAGGMAVSSDGRTLYVPDAASNEVAGISVINGQVLETFTRGAGSSVGYIRVKGHGIVTPTLDPWTFGFGPDLAATPDGRTIFVRNNSGPGHSYNGHTLDFSALYAPGRVLSQALHATDGWDTGNVRAMAVVPDGSGYLAALSGSECRRYDVTNKLELWDVAVLGSANNAVARPDGLLLCGSDTDQDDPDIWLLDLDGNPLGDLETDGDLVDNAMALSSDPFRLVVPTDVGEIEVFELP